MVPLEKTRLAIEDELRSRNTGAWLQVVSEVHGMGSELNFWFLAEDKLKARSAYEIFSDVIADRLPQLEDVKISASFHEIDGNKKITWEFIDDDEIRAGALDRDFGAYPESFLLREDDIFGSA